MNKEDEANISDEKNAKPSPFKKITIIFCMLFLLAAVAVAGASFFALQYFKSPGPLENEATIIIDEGSSLNKIAYQLAENNIIKHPKLFSIMVRISKAGNRMKAGQYSFEPRIAPVQAFGKIANGDVVAHKITIAEGLMTSQILDIIKNAEFMKGSVPDGIKEGELLPETYEYHYGDDRAKLVERMQRSMRETLDKAWENRAENLPIKTKEEALVLASIIEKETGVADERERVAAVFVNRLRKRMRLQTDPTVIYAITKGDYVLERPLMLKDLEMQDPYNTYRNYGLPPGPIANPGADAIKAAVNPAETNEYYFVADGTGGHQFSSTLKEHNNNVQKWRKIQRSGK